MHYHLRPFSTTKVLYIVYNQAMYYCCDSIYLICVKTFSFLVFNYYMTVRHYGIITKGKRFLINQKKNYEQYLTNQK